MQCWAALALPASRLLSRSHDATLRLWRSDDTHTTLLSVRSTLPGWDDPGHIMAVPGGFRFHRIDMNPEKVRTVMSWGSLSDSAIALDGCGEQSLPYLRPNTPGWPDAIRAGYWLGGTPLDSLEFE